MPPLVILPSGGWAGSQRSGCGHAELRAHVRSTTSTTCFSPTELGIAPFGLRCAVAGKSLGKKRR
eukprot:8199311-Alexandrium_andersonii.AAC.1